MLTPQQLAPLGHLTEDPCCASEATVDHPRIGGSTVVQVKWRWKHRLDSLLRWQL